MFNFIDYNLTNSTTILETILVANNNLPYYDAVYSMIDNYGIENGYTSSEEAAEDILKRIDFNKDDYKEYEIWLENELDHTGDLNYSDLNIDIDKIDYIQSILEYEIDNASVIDLYCENIGYKDEFEILKYLLNYYQFLKPDYKALLKYIDILDIEQTLQRVLSEVSENYNYPVIAIFNGVCYHLKHYGKAISDTDLELINFLK